MCEVEQRVLLALRNHLLAPEVVASAVEAYQAERKRLAAELSQQPASNVVEFFPKAAERYRQKVADIHAALSRGEAGDREAVALVRSLIGRIVVHATPVPEPLGLEVEGSLAALMTDAPELEHSGIGCCMPPNPPTPTNRTVVAYMTYVSSMSRSSPRTHRSAESLPLIIPHSKSDQGPRFRLPCFFSTRLAALSARSQTSRWMGRFP